MVSYNDVSKLTYYSENKKKKEFLDLFLNLAESNNVIHILNFIKHERFFEDTSSIKLNFDNKEVLVFKENFLLNLPENNKTTHFIDGFEVTLDYPDIIDYKCSYMHCIKELKYNDDILTLKTQEDYNAIPLVLMNKIKPCIEPYLIDLHKTFLYKVGDVQCGFILDIDLIIKIVELTFVHSHKHIVQEKLFLMKEYNFSYNDFDKMSFLETKHYLKEGINIVNERNNPKTHGA